MDCKEFERLISDFIADKLDFYSLKEFCSHMEFCENCKEELNIQFLVREGMQRLEDGRAFDLQGELNHRLEEARRRVRIHDTFMRIGLMMEVVSAGLLAGFILWILL